MKKLSFLFILAVALIAASCGNKAKEEADAKMKRMQDSLEQVRINDSIAAVEAEKALQDSLLQDSLMKVAEAANADAAAANRKAAAAEKKASTTLPKVQDSKMGDGKKGSNVKAGQGKG